VKLFLKQDALEFASESRLRSLIQKYSEFVHFPIELQASKTVSKEVELEEEEAAEGENHEDLDENAEKKKKTKTVSEQVVEWEQINVNKAIWTRDRTEITAEEYNNFYKSYTKDNQDPLFYNHFRGEGEVDFNSLLYIPKTADWNQINEYYNKQSNIKLYVRRVLIQDTFDDIVPKYLNFIRGVIDSDDLPLNVNRESLQQNKILKTISKKITKKILDMITELSKNKEDYKEFWKLYSRQIKMGLLESEPNKDKLLKLIRFKSSTH